MMRILILGAGAVGGYFGGRLVEWQQRTSEATLFATTSSPGNNNVSNHFSVTFLVRPGRAKQIEQDGLVLKNFDGSITTISNIITLVSEGKQLVPVNPNTTAHFDVIVLACKAYDLSNAVDAIQPFVHSNVAILPLLNGMAHLDIIQERFPEATVWGGTCGLVASLDKTTGIIHRMTPSQFVRAGILVQSRNKEKNGSSSVDDKLKTLMQLLQEAGIDAEVSDDIMQTMWEKWTFLATLGAATCLYSATMGQILSTTYGQEFVLGVYKECNAVATAQGSLPSADVTGQRQSTYMSIFHDKSSIIKASMCRDMESGGPTEADHLLGELIRCAQKHHLETPLLKTAYTKLQIHEAQRQASIR